MQFTNQQVDIVTEHFLIAALWADAPEGTHPRLTQQARQAASVVCNEFIAKHANLFAQAMECGDRRGYGDHPDCGGHPEAAFGHDLWLTLQGHGTGFWDRTELGASGLLGENLTAACKAFGECYLDFYSGWVRLHHPRFT